MLAARLISQTEEAASSEELAFWRDLEHFRDRYASLWRAASEETPEMGERFDSAAQARNERETDRLVQHIDEEVRHCPELPAEREVWRARLRKRIWCFGRECFRFPDHYLGIVLSDAYFRVTAEFARQAEAFDRSIGPEALSQAMRNVWVMNCLQMFLGKRISLSPSIFAYSMLYPYTDNALDSARVSGNTKREMCRRLGLRLGGVGIEPQRRLEPEIFRLIGMIEREFARDEFAPVYRALLAIHRGQVRSLMQQNPGPPPDEEQILTLSVEKGGASVLADGYLVAGRLSRSRAEFFFGVGVVLQLFDDLQDVAQDRDAKRWTLFSRNAHHRPLDCVSSRLYGFLLKVLRTAPRFPISAQHILEDLIRRNCGFLLLQAVSQYHDLFSPGYLRKLEPYSPVRFEYLKSLRLMIAQKHLAQKQISLDRQSDRPNLYQLLA